METAPTPSSPGPAAGPGRSLSPALIAALAEGSGILVRTRRPELGGAFDAARRAGLLVSVLPGIYAPVADAAKVATRARAAAATDPRCVILGSGAAVLAGWAGVPEPETLAVAVQSVRRRMNGFVWRRRRIPPSLVRRLNGFRITSGALTGLDLVEELGEEGLDIALRRGLAPHQLAHALDLTRGRSGNRALRRLLRDSRDLPWSPAERCAHTLLRDAGVAGWEANRAIYDRRGEELLGYGDLVFASLRLIIEIDGDRYHGSPKQAAADRVRDLALAREGWEVVRLPASMVFDHPKQFVKVVREVLASRAARVPSRGGATL